LRHSLVALALVTIGGSLLVSACTPATQSHETETARAAVAADKAVQEAPVQIIDKATGEELYVRYCASCHGMTGRGDGPAADVLAVALPDLTRWVGKGERFPLKELEEAIRGPRPGVHGTADMPVWGPGLMGAGENWTEAQREAFLDKRVRKLGKYLESIQVAGM